MRSRSWMAAFAIAAGGTMTVAPGASDSPVENRVQLELLIAGLGADGCTIEIKPGHAACQFKAVEKTIDRVVGDPIRLEPIPILAQARGADRDCSFAITIKEPGQPPKTVRRGLRLAVQEPGQPTPVQSLRCYLNTPSMASMDDTRRR